MCVEVTLRERRKVTKKERKLHANYIKRNNFLFVRLLIDARTVMFELLLLLRVFHAAISDKVETF